jgi:hypothetical protein
MAGMETRGRRDHAQEAPDSRFVVGVGIVAIIAIALSLAIGIQVPPDVAMLLAP